MDTLHNNQALIEVMKTLGAADFTDIGPGVKIASVPTGRKLESLKPLLDQYLKAPERKKGQASFTTLDSFIAHVLRTKDDNSAIFADDNVSSPALLAVYDYNTKTGDARFGEHRARYAFPVSDEWQAWRKAGAGPMDMDSFAEFLEDRIVDVIDPAGSDVFDSIKEFAVNLALDLATPQRLMTLSRGLKVNVESRVTNAQNLTSGEAQINFETEHKDDNGAPLRVPGGFAIQIPVFRGGAVYQMPVRLRYRVGAGKIVWLVSLHRTDVVFRDAIDEAAKKAADATTLPVFFGAPEAATK